MSGSTVFCREKPQCLLCLLADFTEDEMAVSAEFRTEPLAEPGMLVTQPQRCRVMTAGFAGRACCTLISEWIPAVCGRRRAPAACDRGRQWTGL